MLFTETLTGGGPMKRNYLAVPSLAALLLLGCGGPKNRDTGANAGSESGAMSGSTGQMDTTSMPTDTGTVRSDTGMSGMSGMSSDTAGDTSAARSRTSTADSAKANQTKSGVTDTKTGKSTLGPGVTKTRPDQGQPVTAKGDTIDSSARPNATSDSSAAQ